MNVIVFQLLRFKTSLRSCWNYIPSFYVPSIFPRCFNVFWKVLNLKNSRASKSWTFHKMNIFFTNLYNRIFKLRCAISTFYTCSNYARLIFIFSSTFWSAKWKNSENYFLNSKKNKTKQANVQYTWIEIVVNNRKKFHVISLFNSKKFWRRQRKEEIYRIFVIFDSIPSLVRGDSRLLNIIIARFMDVTRAYLSLSPCLTKTRSTIDYRIIQAKRKRMHFLLSLSSLLLLYKEENSEAERSRLC